MGNSNTQEINPNDLIGKFKEETPTAILIQDLEETSNLVKSDLQKEILLTIVKLLNANSLKVERDIMVKFAFDFYADLSRKMDVPENLISENLTQAEVYFDEKFKRNQTQDV
jgi:hypothetical protein